MGTTGSVLAMEKDAWEGTGPTTPLAVASGKIKTHKRIMIRPVPASYMGGKAPRW
jgi:hypothetical protein